MLKTTQNKRKKHSKIFMLAISNLNSIESKTLIDEEKNYLVLKESIRMMKTRRSDTEKSI